MILDTNALSAVADERPAVVPKFRAAETIEIPVIVLGEYRFGILQSRRRVEYEYWLAENLPACRVLWVDENTAERYAEIRLELKDAGTPIPVNDLWIAALCRQHSLPILSRDKHFDDVKGIRRISW